jgi:hypothetical protein
VEVESKEEEEEESASIAERLGAWRSTRACTTPTSLLSRHWQLFALILAILINLTFDMYGDLLIIVRNWYLAQNKTAKPDRQSKCDFN